MIDIKKYFDGFINITKDPSLKAMYFFINKYNNLDEKLKFIHIDGTNGKGSCVEILANILIMQGYKTGKFMSPHLINYNERININHKNISDQELSDLIISIQPDIDFYNKNNERKITLFEIETIIALLYFYKNKVDIVLLETGLGGLHDCTNIIKKPLVSIISSIGYDHMNILGDDLIKIAEQKAGIIKKNSNTVFFSQESLIDNLIINKCQEQNNKLYLLTREQIKNYRFGFDYQRFDFKNLKDIYINLKGKMQVKNTCLCLEAIKILNELGYNISEKNIKLALKNIVHKGRFEIINKKPLIIYDGAHNTPAIKNLCELVDLYYKNYNKRFIIFVLERKDYESIIKVLLKNNSCAEFIFIDLADLENNNYFAPAEKLFDIAQKYKSSQQNIYIKKLTQAINFVFASQCESDDKKKYVNFITGSFYLYGQAIETIKNQLL